MTANPLNQIDPQHVARRVLLFCLCVEVVIQLLDLLLNYFQLIDSSSMRKIFNVAREESLGNWFSVVQAAVAGLVLLGLHFLTRTANWRTWGWLILALFFIYMSADDAAKIHERVGGYVGKLARSEETLLASVSNAFGSYNWQWALAPFFGAFGLYILIFLWRQLPEAGLRVTLLAAFSCWALAVGIDFVEGREGFFESIAETLDVKKYTVSHPFLMVEEFLEMFGTTLFLSLFVRRFLEQFNEHIPSQAE